MTLMKQKTANIAREVIKMKVSLILTSMLPPTQRRWKIRGITIAEKGKIKSSNGEGILRIIFPSNLSKCMEFQMTLENFSGSGNAKHCGRRHNFIWSIKLAEDKLFCLQRLKK